MSKNISLHKAPLGGLGATFFPFGGLGAVLLLFVFFSCADMENMDDDNSGNNSGFNTEIGTAEFYVLSEGLFNLNNSTLARYSFAENKLTTDYFRKINRRGLGDTANDMAIYGSKLYIVVNVSGQVEVIDIQTGKSIRQIPLQTENGSSRQPRYIAFHKDKAYVCSFDGTVARIDTASLSVETYAQAGRNPDGICVQNNKLYVSNSGGLDSPNYDNTVSVIDLASFSEIKKITVGQNPGKILPDKYNNVYVVVRGDLTANESCFVRIDSQTDAVEETLQESVLNFAINHDTDLAYLYSYDYTQKMSGIKVYNVRTNQIEKENFVTDGTQIQTPFGIAVNPYSGNIYVTDAYDYKVTGDVLCFNPQGQLQFKIQSVGINPNTLVFRDKRSNSTLDDNEQPTSSAFATKVWEYYPAPSQFMNTSTTAYKDGFSANDVLEYATEQIRNKSLLTLGGFGGYIVLGFDHSIPNKQGSYDFKIYGNASYNTDGSGASAEPGIVLVSKDTNGNGLPDDAWYELAGSEYHSDKIIRNYSVTYYRPASLLDEVKWKDNQGNEGVISRNSYHADNSYYPAWIQENEITFTGTRLPDNGILNDANWILQPFAYGYADNRPNNSEYSQFNIDWAVDADGNSVYLDKIDFIKIYSAMNQVCGWLGETSTEIVTVEDLHAEN